MTPDLYIKRIKLRNYSKTLNKEIFRNWTEEIEIHWSKTTWVDFASINTLTKLELTTCNHKSIIKLPNSLESFRAIRTELFWWVNMSRNYNLKDVTIIECINCRNTILPPSVENLHLAWWIIPNDYSCYKSLKKAELDGIKKEQLLRFPLSLTNLVVNWVDRSNCLFEVDWVKRLCSNMY